MTSRPDPAARATTGRDPSIGAAVTDAARYAAHWVEVQRGLQRVPGVQLAVEHDGELVLSRAYGVADAGSRTPLTPQHLFRVASHSKWFAATAVLQLVESGHLRLDDRVDAWLDHLVGTELGTATLRDLLAHGAGVSRDSDDGDFWQLFDPFPDAGELRRMTGLGSGAGVRPVAERFKYSNLGYGLLGLVVEQASGMSFARYLATRIAEPLGLADTGGEWDAARAAEYATGHTGWATSADGAGPLTIHPVETGALAPATGVYSTAEDLVCFAAAHYLGDERLLSDASKRRMQRAEWPSGRDREDYGLGLIITAVGGRRTVGHSGGFPGHISRTMVDPVDRFAVSVLTNAIDGPASALATGVVRLVNLAAEVPADDDAPDLDRFTGHFANLWGRLDVVRLGGRLYALDPGSPEPTEHPVHLTVEDDSRLRIGGGTGYGSYGEAFRYTRAPDGTVTSIRADSGQTMYPAQAYLAALGREPRVSRGGVRA
ncbi:serine hydrolase [Cellulomonas fimi]|uniref:Beta-lactamase family protein n=1 Tax=Cellulomonas fimi TaxID=1708 RepID=A0A7Y0LZ64_CELFI|nr:serine hydrolase domain-containing protein [Cellulomonas fimi]NMR20634.1 beta-lactamase family protein [Cellulomonas fimi]